MMNVFGSYIREFLRTIHPGLLLFCFGFASLLIYLNYRLGIEPKYLHNLPNRIYRFAGFYGVYLSAFAVPYLALLLLKGNQIKEWKLLLFLVLISPAIFALKVSFTGIAQIIQDNVSGAWGRYSAIIANLPSKLIVVLVPLVFIWWQGAY